MHNVSLVFVLCALEARSRQGTFSNAGLLIELVFAASITKWEPIATAFLSSAERLCDLFIFEHFECLLLGAGCFVFDISNMAFQHFDYMQVLGVSCHRAPLCPPSNRVVCIADHLYQCVVTLIVSLT